MKALVVCITLGLLFETTCVPGLGDGYYFDSWTTDSGLPQNSVLAILQTRDGYPWIATRDGLVRYDGARFTVFTTANTEGMKDNECKRLLEDRQGTLWILTDYGLTSYRAGQFHSYSGDAVLSPPFYREYEGGEGELIVHTGKGMVSWREGKSAPLEFEGGGPIDQFSYQEKSGALWFNGRDGLFHRIKDGRLSVYKLPSRYPNPIVHAAVQDAKGNFWVGAGQGFYQLAGPKFVQDSVTKSLGRSPVICLCEDRQANVWAATLAGGLFRLTPKTETPSGAGAPAALTVSAYNPFVNSRVIDRVTVIYQDREGTLWLGATAGGLIHMTEQIVSLYLHSSNVYPIYQDRQGVVWIGGGGRLTTYKDGQFAQVGNKIAATSLAEDGEGSLWIGMNTGLLRFKDGALTLHDDIIGFPGPYSVNAICEDRRGVMWFGTGEGLVEYENGLRRVFKTKDGLAGDEVKAILEDKQGSLWIGTYGGLSRLKDGVFTSYRKSDGLAGNRVRALYEDQDGVLWVGTYDGGLSRIKQGRITTYGTRDGLFNNGVFQILEDARGNFWMGSNLGIYRTSKQQLEDFADGRISRISCVSYGTRDGLLNVECNGGVQPAGVRARDGRLWFPTEEGVAVINPDELPFNTAPPPVLIEDVLIDGQSATRDAVRISPGQDSLEIRYTGISFVKPEQVRFKYKIQELDRDWVEAGTRRSAYFSHLPAGRYRFTVIAANADGVWNLDGASISIQIVPPFFRTLWFTLLVAACLAAVAITLYRRRVTGLKQAAGAREAFSRQLIESQEAERKRIAAELHDSLGQSLSIIMGRATLVLNRPADSRGAFDQVEEIAATASDAIKEVREIAYNLRPVDLDRLGLAEALDSMARKVSISTGIDIAAEIDDIDKLFPMDQQVNLYRIVQECINNIVKHSGASEASIEVKRLNDRVTIAVQDNGRGFAISPGSSGDGRPSGSGKSLSGPAASASDFSGGPSGLGWTASLTGGSASGSAATSPGFGLVSISERARILGGKQTIQSEPGRGTTVKIDISLKEDGNER